jgi:hypothetical protein
MIKVSSVLHLGSVIHEPTLVKDKNAIADALYLLKDMGGKKNRPPFRELADKSPDLPDLIGIEPACGLIEDENPGVVDECLGEPDPLAIPFGKGADHLIFDLFKPARLDHPVQSFGDLLPGHPFQSGDESQIIANPHLSVKRRGFGEIPDERPHLHGGSGNLIPANPGIPRGRWEIGGDHPHRGGFPRPVRTQKPYNLSGIDPGGDP